MRSEAVLLTLDPALAEAIEGLRSEILERCGGTPLASNGVMPHVTLSICDGHDPREVQRGMDRMVASHPAPALDLVCVGAFGGNAHVAFVAPTVHARLLALHADWHAMGIAHSGRPFSAHYEVGTWVPHITVGYGVPEAQLGTALELARSALPIAGRAHTIEHVAFEASTAVVLGTLGRTTWSPETA